MCTGVLWKSLSSLRSEIDVSKDEDGERGSRIKSSVKSKISVFTRSMMAGCGFYYDLGVNWAILARFNLP